LDRDGSSAAWTLKKEIFERDWRAESYPTLGGDFECKSAQRSRINFSVTVG
jgi:hypothetical protein